VAESLVHRRDDCKIKKYCCSWTNFLK
jgi:hypothetical protein